MEQRFFLQKNALVDKGFIRIISYLILLLPVIWGFFLVLNYGVNLFFWDEWSYAYLFDAFKNGTLSVAELFRQHNEHRMFFPNIVTLIIGLLTDVNSKAFMLTSMCFLTVEYACILFYLKQCILDIRRKFVLGILVGFLVFHSSQYENILWGFQIAWFMISANAVIAFFCFSKIVQTRKIKNNDFIILLICTIVASFSSLHGLFVWLVLDFVLFLLVIQKKQYMKIPHLAVFFLVQTICFVLYFYSYNKVSKHPAYLQNGIMQAFYYYVTALGQIFSHKTKFAALTGVLISIISCLYIVKAFINKNFLERSIFPLGLIIFGNIFIASTAIGRSGFGVGQALSSRYITNVVLIIVGILLCSSYICSDKRQKVLTVFITVCTVVLVIRNPFLLGFYENNKIGKITDSFVLTKYPESDFSKRPALSIISPNSSYANAHFILKSHSWNVFSKSSEKLLESYASHTYELPSFKVFDKQFSYSIDWEMRNKNILIIEGWAFHDNDDYDLFIKNGAQFYKAQKTHRGDVKETFHLKNDSVGFNIFIKEPDTAYQIYFVNKTKKEIYVVGKYSVDVSAYEIEPFESKFYIDSETDTEIRGWAFNKDDYCEVFLESEGVLYKANKEVRPDVQDAFNLKWDNVGFQISMEMSLSEYKLYLFDHTERKKYLLKEKFAKGKNK